MKRSTSQLGKCGNRKFVALGHLLRYPPPNPPPQGWRTTQGILPRSKSLHAVLWSYHHFRVKVENGRRGRPRLVEWAELHIAQLVKRTYGERIERRLAFGDLFEALHMIEQSQGKRGTINTAFVERLNATLRTWLPALTRRSRHAGNYRDRLERHFFLTAATYNFVRPHRSLRIRVEGKWVERTPGMVAGLTDRPWTVEELLRFKVPPPQKAA